MASSDPSSAPASVKERRTVPRYPLIASVEILESSSAMRLSGRISEISRKGCYVDVLNPLPVGTAIQLRISRDNGSFASAGRVIYADQGMGMGVVFVGVPAEQLKILDAWIAELAP
jgi:hypothetical protein